MEISLLALIVLGSALAGVNVGFAPAYKRGLETGRMHGWNEAYEENAKKMMPGAWRFQDGYCAGDYYE